MGISEGCGRNDNTIVWLLPQRSKRAVQLANVANLNILDLDPRKKGPRRRWNGGWRAYKVLSSAHTERPFCQAQAIAPLASRSIYHRARSHKQRSQWRCR